MKSKSILPYAITAMLTLATACGGDKKSSDSTGTSGDELSTVEFDSMVDALSSVGGFGFFGLDQSSEGLAAQTIAAQTQTVPYDETSSCPGGGTIREHGNLTLTLSNNNTSYHYAGTMTQTYNGCKGTGSNGTVFTFSGGPTLTFDYTFNSSGVGSYTLHETGTINWATGGKAGGCGADVTITVSVTAAGVSTGSYTGTMCGHSVNEHF